MPPQPLSSFRRKKPIPASIDYNAPALRPNQAAQIMRIIAIWSHIDQLLTIMTTTFLKTDFETVTAMLAAITSSAGKRAAIKAAAQSALKNKPDDLKLFEAVLSVTKASRERRHEYAHHLWGHTEEIKDAILLVDPKYMAEHHAKSESATQRWLQRPTAFTIFDNDTRPEFPNLDDSKIMVHRDKNIAEDLKQAQAAYGMFFNLRFVLSSHPASDHMRRELLRLPPLKQALQSPCNGKQKPTRHARPRKKRRK